MNGRERGFLLLTSQLGNPERRPLSVAQFRMLAARVRAMELPTDDRELTAADLTALGYGGDMARRILALLEDQILLEWYLGRGARCGCVPITRVSPEYPLLVRHRLGDDSPGCLWAKGDGTLLQNPTVSLAGSRDLSAPNRGFAREVGRQAAIQGFTLVSGNARGADREAQEACLSAGGTVIAVVADELESQPERDGVLYLSEDGFDLSFTAQRAISRNRVIHCLGLRTMIAQSSLQTGGTWDGTVKNLRFGWSPVYCFDDGSSAAHLLAQMGAELICLRQLENFVTLPEINDLFLTNDA